MLSVTKFYSCDLAIANGALTHTLRLALTDTAPIASQTSFDPGTNHPPPAAANGYTTGGAPVTLATPTQSSGSFTQNATAVTFTANTGGIGPFRYVVLYDDTASGDPLLVFWDLGANAMLANSGDTYTWKPNGSATTGKLCGST